MRPILRFVPVLVALALPIAVAAPAAAATSVTATPDTNLSDGDVVQVAGSGFTPGDSIGFCQGVRTSSPSQSDCDGGGYALVAADDQGNISGTQRLRRFIFIPSQNATVDCANAADACVLGAADSANIGGTAAYATLHFAPAPPVIQPSGATDAEGDSGVHDVAIPVNLSGPSTQTVTVQWTTLVVTGAPDFQALPPDDYTPASGTVSFAPGETTHTVPVSVNGDVAIEPDEYFVVSFHDPTNATIGGFYGLGFGVIQNDDTLPSVVPSGATASEGNAGVHDLEVPVSLSKASIDTVTVEWTTLVVTGAPDSQALPPDDYTPASGTVSFAPGETTHTVAVSVNGDVAIEPDEYFVVSFHDPTNATIGGFYGLGFGVIQNDD